MGFSKVNRKQKKGEIFLLFLQIKKEQRRTCENFEKMKTNNMYDTMESGEGYVTPSLGFWPKSGLDTAGPRSFLQLRGSTGTSTGSTGLQVRRPKTWDPPTKKAPRSRQKKTLHPMG